MLRHRPSSGTDRFHRMSVKTGGIYKRPPEERVAGDVPCHC